MSASPDEDCLDAQRRWTEAVHDGMLEVLRDGEGFADADLAHMSLEELERWVEAEMWRCDEAFAWTQPPPRWVRPLIVSRVVARLREGAKDRLREWRHEDPEGYESYMDRREEQRLVMDQREAALADAIEALYPENWYADF